MTGSRGSGWLGCLLFGIAAAAAQFLQGPASDGLVNLIVTVRIRFTGYTRETGIASKRRANDPYRIPTVTRRTVVVGGHCRP